MCSIEMQNALQLNHQVNNENLFHQVQIYTVFQCTEKKHLFKEIYDSENEISKNKTLRTLYSENVRSERAHRRAHPYNIQARDKPNNSIPSVNWVNSMRMQSSSSQRRQLHIFFRWLSAKVLRSPLMCITLCALTQKLIRNMYNIAYDELIQARSIRSQFVMFLLLFLLVNCVYVWCVHSFFTLLIRNENLIN